MSTTLSPEQRFDLITRGLEEVQDGDIIEAALASGKSLKGLWSTAPTGRPHIGYLIPMIKMAEFARADVQVIFNIADIWTFLIKYVHTFELISHRGEIYKFVLGAVLEGLGTPLAKISFVKESDHHLTREKLFMNLRIWALSTQSHVLATGDDIKDTPMLSPMLCPPMEVLNKEIHDVDFEFGGVDQRGLFDFANNYFPKLGYRKRAHLVNEMLPGLNGGKMSASIPASKIDCLDPPETIDRKVRSIPCEEGDVVWNGILALIKLIVMPISKLRLEMIQDAGGAQNMPNQRPFSGAGAPEGTLLTIGAGTKDGGPRHYTSYDEVERDYVEGKLDPEEMKLVVAEAIKQVLAPVRKAYESNEEWQAVEKLAFPDPEKQGTPSTAPYQANFCYPVCDLSNDLVKLTPFNPTSHAASYFAHTSGSTNPEVYYAHMPLGPFSSAADFTVNFFDVVVRPDPTMVFYAVIDKTRPPAEDTDGALAGIIAYTNTSTVNQSTDIGYLVMFPPFQGTHVTSNAVGLLLQYALDPPTKGGLGLRRVQWQTSSANETSMRSAESMGFRKEGVLRWDRPFSGGGSKGKQVNGKQIPNGDGKQVANGVGKQVANGDGKHVANGDGKHVANGDGKHVANGDGKHVANGDGKDLGRDTVVYSICWDDWEEGVREKMGSRN